MRLAIFTLLDGTRIAVNPQKVTVVESRDKKGVQMVDVHQRGYAGSDTAVQGTFEEAVNEVDVALSLDMCRNWEFAVPARSDNEPSNKSGRCLDCGSSEMVTSENGDKMCSDCRARW